MVASAPWVSQTRHNKPSQTCGRRFTEDRSWFQPVTYFSGLLTKIISISHIIVFHGQIASVACSFLLEYLEITPKQSIILVLFFQTHRYYTTLVNTNTRTIKKVYTTFLKIHVMLHTTHTCTCRACCVSPCMSDLTASR